MLDERKRKILQAIIDDYVLTAEPIGSRTIARKYKLGISPATIRNEMADLEILGFLEQPHTSAGRIPSAKGYRFYVDCLMSPPKISANEVALIEQWYKTRARRLSEVFQETAKMLSRMTRNISLVSAPQVTQKCIFKYMQFLPLDERRVILVLVTDVGFVENKVIDVAPGTDFEELQELARQVNRRLGGLPLDKIKASLLDEVKKDILLDTDLLNFTLETLSEALVNNTDQKVYLGGTTQLLSQPEFRDVEKIKGLLSMLEEQRLLKDILQTSQKDGVVVSIGEENSYSGIQDCSMVQATYRFDGQIVGAIAVLGPTRMEYGKIVAVLEFMHSHLGEILKQYRS